MNAEEKSGERTGFSLPIRSWLPSYRRQWLRGDLMAGLVVAALAVPQSLGYAAIAGMPVQIGLYAVPTAMLAYAFFGSSRQLVVGPVSTVSVLSGSLVASLGPVDEQQAVAYTVALALGAGVVLVVAGLLRVGWIAEFLSKPIVTGFVFGLTLLVIIGEMPKMVGVTVTDPDVMTRIGTLLSGFLVEWDLATTGIAVGCLVVMFAGGRALPRVPWALILVVASIVASEALDWQERGIAVVGEVPAGLPTPGLPAVGLDQLGMLALGGAALALVGLAEGLSAARLFAAKGGYRVDADQELVAAGAANLASGLFGGLGVAGSLSKTAAAADARGRSQMMSLVTALVAVLVIAVFAPALSSLPLAVLSAIVVKAVWGLMDLDAIRRYRDIRRLDFTAALVGAVGVLLLGPLPGLLVAVLASVLGLVYRSSRVSVDELGRIKAEKAAWGAVKDHPERRTVPGIRVLRISGPVFWVNAGLCTDLVTRHIEGEDEIQAVVLDLEGTDTLDTTAADALAELASSLHDQGVDLYLVRVRYAVRNLLRRSEAMAEIGEDHVWHSISEGVRRARQDHGVTAKAAASEDSISRIPVSGEDEYGHRWSPFGP
jgi:high affinity sulfate transporter 1